MKNLKEEVDITPYVERGLVGVNVDAVRDNINTFLTGSLSKCFITPYIALEKIRKVLANFHIFLPKTTFLEGDRGVEVFQIKQFGEVMGMRDNGEVVTKIDDPYSLYFEYKMNDRGLFEIFCEIVNQEELDELLDQVEDDINDEDIEDDREERLDEGEVIKFPGIFKKRNEEETPEERQKRFLRALTGPGNLEPSKSSKLTKESSESVSMSGPETGARRISGAPDSGMSMDYGSCDDMSKIKFVLRKKVMKKLKEEKMEDKLQEARGLSKGEMEFVKRAKEILRPPNKKRVKKVKLPKGYDALWAHSEKTNRRHMTKANLEGFARFAEKEFMKARKAKPNFEKYKEAYSAYTRRKNNINNLLAKLKTKK